MKRTPLCRHPHEPTKKPLLNKTNRHLRKSSISVKKTFKANIYHLHHHQPYSTKKKRLTFCNANNNDMDLNDKNDTNNRLPEDLDNVDSTCLSTLRHEAYDELHRQMQQYNDSFVIRMQQAEQQRHDPVEQRPSHVRRRSFQKQSYHHRRRSSLVSSKQHSHTHHHHPHLPCCHQENNDPCIEELVDMLEIGTIKDYSLLTEWELCQNPQSELEEDQHGGFGDLW